MIRQLFLNTTETQTEISNFYIAYKFLLLFTACWLLVNFADYQSMLQRPTELFMANNWFSRVFIVHFPSYPIYFTLWLFASISIVLLFLKFEDSSVLKSILVFSLLWLNAVRWSYGYNGHSNHLFLLAHFFTIFFPANIKKNTNDSKDFFVTLRVIYTGLLLTYTYSGLWKIFYIFMMILRKSNDVNWLDPKASYLNSIVCFHLRDIPFEYDLFNIVKISWVSQIGFCSILIIEVGAIIAAFYKPLRFTWVSLLILMHIINYVLVRVNFAPAAITLLILFFPYQKIAYFNRRFHTLPS
jgi:hypothetical protein